MPHHSDRFDINDLLGATGKFPQGKLTPSDEGELKFTIGIKDNKVIINFGTPVAWFGLDKNAAVELGQTIIDKAKEL